MGYMQPVGWTVDVETFTLLHQESNKRVE